jgi:membrane fusion protein, multidrug efflux system
MTEDTAAPPAARPRSRRAYMIAAIAVAAILVLALVLALPPHFIARTDDAYVEADIVTVAPKVPGYVSLLRIDDNSRFKAGAELMRIDDRDYVVALRSAQAALRAACDGRAMLTAQIDRQRHLVAAARATLTGDRATFAFAGHQRDRYTTLAKEGYGSVEHRQQTETDHAVSAATLRHDEAQYRSTTAQVSVYERQIAQADAQIAQARAALRQAALNLSYTRIVATADGSVANRLVRVGNYVTPGQAMFSEVPNAVYVIANYKEIQIARMRVGQAVTIHVDAFPGLVLRGHVDSFQRGTGSRFALLPPENATGNFVKVVQRVPVKILIDEPAARHPMLAPGMSVETRVAVASAPWILRPFL